MNAKDIWDRIMKTIQNPYGTAALMGNLKTESQLNSKLLESSKARKMGITSDIYTQNVDNGQYTKEDFIRDKAGYGFVQWTYWSRKELLYDYARKVGKSIGDPEMQLDYILEEELPKYYKSVFRAMKEATKDNFREVSDTIALKYEKPSNTSEEFLANRAKFGQEFLNLYHSEKSKEEKIFVKAIANVNLRTGNSKAFAKVGSLKKGKTLPFVAESINNWYAVEYGTSIVWLDSEFAIKETINQNG